MQNVHATVALPVHVYYDQVIYDSDVIPLYMYCSDIHDSMLLLSISAIQPLMQLVHRDAIVRGLYSTARQSLNRVSPY